MDPLLVPLHNFCRFTTFIGATERSFIVSDSDVHRFLLADYLSLTFFYLIFVDSSSYCRGVQPRRRPLVNFSPTPRIRSDPASRQSVTLNEKASGKIKATIQPGRKRAFVWQSAACYCSPPEEGDLRFLFSRVMWRRVLPPL